MRGAAAAGQCARPVSARSPTIAELAAARREAEECLALHEAGAPEELPPAYDESWDEIVLQRLHTAARSGRVPVRGPVAELRHHDTAHGTPYVATLRAWLDAQGDLARAAESLGVHENTVRYRLRKMAEVTPLGLDDPRTRFAAMIELAAGDMSESRQTLTLSLCGIGQTGYLAAVASWSDG